MPLVRAQNALFLNGPSLKHRGCASVAAAKLVTEIDVDSAVSAGVEENPILSLPGFLGLGISWMASCRPPAKNGVAHTCSTGVMLHPSSSAMKNGIHNQKNFGSSQSGFFAGSTFPVLVHC